MLFDFCHDGFHGFGIVGFDSFFEFGYAVFDGLFNFSWKFIAVFFKLFFGLINHRVGFVFDFDFFFSGLIVFGVGFCFVDHFFDFGISQAAGSGDSDILFFAGAEIFGGDVQNAVGVDVECNFDLGDAAGGGSDAVEFEAADSFVIAGKFTFPLKDVDINCGLIVAGG